MKKIIFAIFCAVLLSSLLLTSCSNDKNGGKTEIKQNENSIVFEKQALYELVRPSSCSAELTQAVADFRSKLSSLTDAEFQIKDDFSRTGEYDSSTKEILIADTKYAETASVKEALGDNKFAIVKSENKIVIVGVDDKYVIIALNYFLNDLKHEGEKGVHVMYNDDFYYNEQEAIQNLKINGVPFKDYTILYKELDRESLTYARSVRDDIEAKLSYKLETSATATDYNIIFSFSDHSSYVSADYMHYEIKLEGSDLIVSTGGYFSLEYLIPRFTDTLFQNGIFDIKENFCVSGTYLNAPEYTKPKNSDIRMISANILAEYESWNSTIDPKYRTEIFAGNMAFYDAEIIGIQECSPYWIKFLSKEYKSPYKMIEVPNDNVFTYILYNAEKLEVLEQGYKQFTNSTNPRARGIAYGVFKDKDTQKIFVFGSTHWNTGDDEIARSHANESAQILNSLKTKYNCSIYCVGDFNSSEPTNVYSSFMQMTDMEDTMYSTTNRTNKLASWHELGKEDFSFYSCDHIFASKGVRCVKFRTLAENYQIYASDHSWLCADIALP